MKFKDLRHKLTWPLSYCTIVTVKCLALVIPFRKLNTFAGLISWIILLIPGCRRMIIANLNVAFPDKTDDECKSLCKSSARNITLTFLEFLWIRGNHGHINKISTFGPGAEELLCRYHAREQGVIVISPHIGNWEIGNLMVNANGIKTWAVAKEQMNPFTERLIDEGRKLSGSGIIHEKGAAKKMMRLLKQHEMVMLLIDQNTAPKYGGIFVEFFGLPVTVSRAPMSFARKCNAEILLGACIRQADGRLELQCRELDKPISEYDDDDALCRDIMKIHEDFIREHPDQYLWLYKRFRYIPSNWDGDRSRFPYYCRELDVD